MLVPDSRKLNLLCHIGTRAHLEKESNVKSSLDDLLHITLR